MSAVEAEGAKQPPGLLLDVLSADQFNLHNLGMLNPRADRFQNFAEIARAKDELQKDDYTSEYTQKLIEAAGFSPGELLKQQYRRYGKLAISFWFNEPSTRTIGSFDAARALLDIERLGHTDAARASSSAKDESLADSLRTVNEHLRYFGGGALIIRHPDVGSASLAAEIIDFPVINAGDGQNEHPTQALLDQYTIRQRLGRLEGLNVVMGGDPKYGRTIHSLAKILTLFPDNKITFIGEESDWLEESDTKKILEEKGVDYAATTELDPLSQADVIYWTRLQVERFAKGDQSVLDSYAKKYTITDEILKTIPAGAIIMHPLPRGPEIPESIDTDPRAAYWDQVANAVPVRTALLEMVLRNYNLLRMAGGLCLNNH